MVGFISEPTYLDDQAPKLKNLSDPLDSIDHRANDLSLADSFLDFDSIKNWFEDIPNQEMADGEGIKIDAIEEESCCGDTSVQGQIVNGSKPILDGHAPIDGGSGGVVKVDKGECETSGNFSCSIAEEIRKVSLVCGSESSLLVGENGMKIGTRNEDSVKTGTVSDKDVSESSESESASTSSSSSSSTSSSSSSDDQDDDVEGKEEEEEEEDLEVKQEFERDYNEAGEVEEGEIRDADGQGMAGMIENDDDDIEAMVGWSDTDVNDAEDEEGDGGGMGGPIRSKNELKVLPLVPPVDVTLLPHHQMMPVGVVLSIVGTQVIVEGVEKHNPLNDGSILWITDSRTPLGFVDEIFGPVKNPYYVVRYNSENEVPAGIHGGTSISFVPEFASHVLNNKDIYKKGYDASGANDEEVSDSEFSDDEKEAEYKRMQKMTKRGKEEKVGNNKSNRKKGKSRVEPWKNEQPSTKQTSSNVGHQSSNQHQHHFSPVPALIDHGNGAPSFAVGQGVVSGTGLVPPFPPTAQTACSSGVWTNGMPFQPTMQPQTPFFPNGIPINSMPWLLQNNQYPQQMPMPNRMPFNQQADPNQMFHSAAVLPGDQPNNFSGSTYVQGRVGQNNFNQSTFGMGLQGHPSQQTLNALQQGVLSNGLHTESNYNNMPQSMLIPGNVKVPQQFNVGASSSRGRRPFHRGGGRFAGGGGRQQSR